MKVKIRVLFYKYKKKPLNFAIQLWTGLWNWKTPPYSHTEIWIRGRFEPFTDIHTEGDCYTSTMYKNANGVVRRPARDVLKHPDRWDYIEIEISNERYLMLCRFLAKAVRDNKGYDLLTLGKFFLPFAKWRRSDPKKFICSEFVQYMLWLIGIFDKQALWSPRRLWKKLNDKGYYTIPLKRRM